MRQIYLEFSTLVKKCLEISYNSIVALLKRIRTEFLLPGESIEDDYIPELYPCIFIIIILHYHCISCNPLSECPL